VFTAWIINEAKKSCRREKRKRIDDIARETEEAVEQRDMKMVYDTTRLRSRKRTVQSTPVKGKSRVVLIDTDDQCNRWKEHLQEILTRPPSENPPDFTEGPSLAKRTGQAIIRHPSRSLEGRRLGLS